MIKLDWIRSGKVARSWQQLRYGEVARPGRVVGWLDGERVGWLDGGRGDWPVATTHSSLIACHIYLSLALRTPCHCDQHINPFAKNLNPLG